MPRNFYSGTESELAGGSANMVSILTPDPGSFGITSEQLASYSALASEFRDLLMLSTSPSTRTPVAIAGKKRAKRLLKTASAQLGAIIAATVTVSDSQLAALALNARLNRQRRDVPATPPVVTVISVQARRVMIRVREAESQRRGLPFGAIGAYLYWFAGDTPPDDPRGYHFYGVTTRAKTQIDFPNSVPSGATVWLSACWVSGRAETSTPSDPTNFTIQGGAVTPEAAMKIAA